MDVHATKIVTMMGFGLLSHIYVCVFLTKGPNKYAMLKFDGPKKNSPQPWVVDVVVAVAAAAVVFV